MQGDLERAQALSRHARALDKTILCTSAQESLLALDVFLRLQSGKRIPPRRMLDRLRRLHLRTRACGVRDFETGVLVAGLLRVGEEREAGVLYHEYCRVRRTRLQPHSALKQLQNVFA